MVSVFVDFEIICVMCECMLFLVSLFGWLFKLKLLLILGMCNVVIDMDVVKVYGVVIVGM